jgi:hypothetical protein
MKSIRHYLNKHIFSSKEKTITLFILLVLAITIPLTLNLLDQQQDTRKGAAYTNGADITLSPSKSSVQVGEEFTVNIQMTSNTFEITGAETYINFPKNIFRYISFTNGGFLPTELIPAAESANGISFTFVSLLTAPKKGTGSLGTLRLQAIAPSTQAGITVGNSTFVTALGEGRKNADGQLEDSYNVLNNSNNTTITVTQTTGVTITSNPTLTNTPTPSPTSALQPTITNTPTPTKTPTPTLTVTPSPTPTVTPTPTPLPTLTPTPDPNLSHVKIEAQLPGIGLSETSGTKTPVRTARDLEMQIFNSSNTQVKTIRDAVAFDGNIYKGNIKVGNDLPAGSYTIKIRLDNTLWRQIPGIVRLAPSSTADTTRVVLINGDVDGNNEMNLEDYKALINCYKTATTCEDRYRSKADLNDDGTTNEVDYNLLLKNFESRKGD